jgi:hypothetical protein
MVNQTNFHKFEKLREDVLDVIDRAGFEVEEKFPITLEFINFMHSLMNANKPIVPTVQATVVPTIPTTATAIVEPATQP